MVMIKDIQLVDEVPYSGPERRTAQKAGFKVVAINILAVAIGIAIGVFLR